MNENPTTNSQRCAHCREFTANKSTVTVNGVHTCGSKECLDLAFQNLGPIRSFKKSEVA